MAFEKDGVSSVLKNTTEHKLVLQVRPYLAGSLGRILQVRPALLLLEVRPCLVNSPAEVLPRWVSKVNSAMLVLRVGIYLTGSPGRLGLVELSRSDPALLVLQVTIPCWFSRWDSAFRLLDHYLKDK